MKKKLMICLIVCMLVFTGLSALSTAKPSLKYEEKPTLDPGVIRGPIWGRIRGYEFTGPYSDHLELDTICIRYFGIGYAFNSGLYPRVYRDRHVTFSYPNFKGIITPTFIIGTISGLPGE